MYEVINDNIKLTSWGLKVNKKKAYRVKLICKLIVF